MTQLVGNGARVMIVEDEPIIAMEIKATLDGLGYDVTAVVTSGEEAVEKASECTLDIMLIDITLSGEISGIDAINRIREKYDIPFVFLTAHTDEKVFRSAIETKPYGYLVKPVGKSELYTTIETALQRYLLEKRLRESEEKYRMLFNSVNDAIFVHLPEGRFLDVNRVACERLGYSREELLRMSPADVDTPEFAERIPERLRELSGRPALFETAHVTRDGSVIPVELSSREINYGGMKAVLSIARDITERKRFERRLNESVQQFRLVAENVKDILWIVDIGMLKLTWVSPSVINVLGYTPEEAIRLKIYDLLTHESLEEAMSLFAEEVDREGDGNADPCRSTTIVLEAYHRDGSRHWIETTVKAIRDEEERITGIIGASRDICWRKEADQKLKRDVAVSEAVAELSKSLIAERSIDEVSQIVLDFAKRLTESEFGFAGYLDPQTGYLTCSTMTRDIWERCNIQDKSIFFEKHGGLWGWVHEKREPLLSNSPGTDPRSAGIPEGHLPVRRFLSAPAVFGDALLGQIALANAKRDYNPDDLHLVEQFAMLYALSVKRARDEAQLLKTIREKETLLKEVHHRVKNNLQIVLSLLQMQETRYGDADVISALQAPRDRIRVMALVHERLYGSKDLARIDLAGYVNVLARQLYQTYVRNPNSIALSLETQSVCLNINQAIPCGLIINELITNAFKHAFPETGGEKGMVNISLRLLGNKLVEITVADNGVGISEEVDVNSSTSLGMKLVSLLTTHQLMGELDVRRERGTSITVRFALQQ